jgi:hypothetical protein
MKVSLLLVSLFVASALGVAIKPRPIQFHDQVTYKYRYVGKVITGLPGVSDHVSGYQLRADVNLNQLTDGSLLMRLDNITLGHAMGELSTLEGESYSPRTTAHLESQLTRPVKFELKQGSFKWIEFDSSEEQWSINVKKALVDLFQVDVTGANAYRPAGETWSDIAQPMAFTAYEKGIKGVCPTSYDIFSAVDRSQGHYTPLADNFFFNVTKTRNYENCLTSVKLSHENWDIKGCVEYCGHKETASFSQSKAYGSFAYLPGPLSASSACNCADFKSASPLEQFSTVRYNITMDENVPTIEGIHAAGKIIVDNHGPKVVVSTHQRLTLVSRVRVTEALRTQLQGKIAKQPIRAESLTFSTYNSTMEARSGHVLPLYNLFVPTSQGDLIKVSIGLLKKVAEDVTKPEIDTESQKEHTVWYLTRLIQNLAYLKKEQIEQVYQSIAAIPVSERYTKSLKSVARQLFLDALAHVGTNDVVEWTLEAFEKGHFLDFEVKQLIEVIPANLYYPTKAVLGAYRSLIEAVQDQPERYSRNPLHASAVVAYGKLIAKACRPVESLPKEQKQPVQQTWWSPEQLNTPIRDNMASYPGQAIWKNINMETIRSAPWEGKYVQYPETEMCKPEDVERYVRYLADKMERSTSFATKMAYAQGLAHTGSLKALAVLKQYIVGDIKLGQTCPGYQVTNVSRLTEECNFFRSAIIYSVHHMIPVNPALVRALVLPVYRNPSEAYEVRLAAFTLFMCTGPSKHDLQSIAAGLWHETNRQVISMVRSIFEETANFTAPCNKPLAQAAAALLPTLPKVNLDGLYSQANYNEWYSEEANTGAYSHYQFVASNVSTLPRHGYLSMGGHWGSHSSSVFTLAYQQKGFEELFRSLVNPEILMKLGSIKSTEEMNKLFGSLGVIERLAEEPKAKIFLKLYEQTALFTLDRETIAAAAKEFTGMMVEFGTRFSAGNFHWVRFFSPASYNEIVPSDLGLPVTVYKARPHIVSLKVEESKFTLEPRGFNVSLQVTPQILYSSIHAVSVFQQGIHENSGISGIKRFQATFPVRVSLGYNWARQLVTWSIIPRMESPIMKVGNINRVFQASNIVGQPWNVSPFGRKLEINHMPLRYTFERQYVNPILLNDIKVKIATQRPEFPPFEKLAGQRPIHWLLERYQEINGHNFDIEVTMVYNKFSPVQGIAGSMKYFFGVLNNQPEIESIMQQSRSDLVNQEMIARIAKKFYPQIDLPNDETTYIKPDPQDGIWEYEELYAKIHSTPVNRIPHEKLVAELITKYEPKNTQNRPTVLYRSFPWAMWTFGRNEPEMVAGGNLYLVQAVDKASCWFKFDGLFYSRSPKWSAIPRTFTIETALRRPALPNELFFKPADLANQQAFLDSRIYWGAERPEEKIVLKGKFERTVVDEIVSENFVQPLPKPWYVRQCEQDQISGKTLSPACAKAHWENAYYNKVSLRITYKDLPKQMVNVTSKLWKLTKLTSLSYWKPVSYIAAYEAENTENQIEIIGQHSKVIPGRPMVTFEVKTPRETAHFHKMFLPINRFPSMYPPMYHSASYLPKDRICALSEKYVRTFDNVTYDKPIIPHDYILAMDCSPAKRFAVAVKDDKQTGLKTVKITVRQQKIVIKPTINEQRAEIELNGSPVTIYQDKPAVLYTGLEISTGKIFLQRGNLIIELPLENLRIVFNGRVVKVQSSIRYLGKTCGLCGNMDQEADFEFTRADGSVSHAIQEMIGSYIVNSDEVEGPVKPGKYPYFWLWNDANDVNTNTYSLPVVRRHLIITYSDKTCFSQHSLPTCRPDEKVIEGHELPVKFICMPTPGSPIIQDWTREAKTRLLPELQAYSASEEKTITVPIKCSKN